MKKPIIYLKKVLFIVFVSQGYLKYWEPFATLKLFYWKVNILSYDIFANKRYKTCSTLRVSQRLQCNWSSYIFSMLVKLMQLKKEVVGGGFLVSGKEISVWKMRLETVASKTWVMTFECRHYGNAYCNLLNLLANLMFSIQLRRANGKEWGRFHIRKMGLARALSRSLRQRVIVANICFYDTFRHHFWTRLS